MALRQGQVSIPETMNLVVDSEHPPGQIGV